MPLTPAPVGTPGAAVASANNVADPTTLTPSTGSGYAVGDTLLCFTACRSATPTVATPAGWTSILNVTGTNGRLALFAKVAASTSEAAPSVVWSGLTTGTSGTPCQAVVAAFTNLDDAVLTSMADVVGAASSGAASTSVTNGGAGITTLADKDLVLTLTTRLDDAFTTFTAPSGFTNVTAAMGTTSGADFAMAWAYQVKTPAGAISGPAFGLTGASSFASTGVMVALKGAPVVYSDTPSAAFPMSGSVVESWSSAAYQNLVLATSGLVSYWRLDEASGNALDSKGTNPGTVAGGITRQVAGLITGDLDGAVRGDGAAGTYISVPSGSLPGSVSQLTWECWITLESYVSGRSILNRSYPFLAQTSNTGFRWYTRDVNSIDTIIDTSQTIKVGQRQHIVAVYDSIGGSMKLYVDGASVGTQSRTPNADLTNPSTLYMLTSGSGAAGSTGTIDEVAVYNVALTAQQVLDHYLTGKAASAYEREIVATPGVVSYWRLNEPSGNALDFVDNNPLTTIGAGVTRAVLGLLTGDTDKSVQLDGTSTAGALASYKANMNVGAKVTLEAWVKPNAVVSGAKIAGRLTTSFFNWGLDIASGPLYRFQVRDSASTTYAASGGTPVVGTIVHLVGVYDSVAQTIKLYANGIEVASAATGTNLAKNDSGFEFFVGADAGTAFNGVVDEAAFYNVALTPTQILNHYLIGSGAVFNNDAPTGIFPLSGTRTESYALVRSDAPTGLFKLSGTRTESFQGPTRYDDAPNQIFPLSGSLAAESNVVAGAREWAAMRIHERPPLRHSIAIVTPTGRHYRWGEDERLPENIFNGLRFGSAMPGGYDSCDCVLPRKPGVTYNDLERLSTLQVIRAGGSVVGEYRLERTPQTSGDQMAISPSAVGWQAHLDDNKGASMIYFDRNLGDWRGVSAGRSTGLTSAWAPRSHSVVPDSLLPALDLLLEGAWTAPLALCEAWYDAGPGNSISELRGSWATSASITNPADANWQIIAALNPVDNANTGDGSATDLAGAGSGTVARTATTTTNRRFAMLQFFYNAAGGIDGGKLYVRWTYVRVIGNHGLTIRGTTPIGEGLYCSDVVDHAVRKWAPMLNITADSIQPTTYFIIQQLAFKDTTTAGEIVKQSTRFGLEDWAVWSNKTFYLNQRNMSPLAKKWRARIGPAKLEQTGQQMDQVWESILVQYNDVDGSTRLVGPPGSGADFEEPSLKDNDPANPANMAGITRRDKLTMGTATKEQATNAGIGFLREAKAIDRSGRAALVGHVEDDRGVLYPYSEVKGGDAISFVDAADTSYRRIVKADHDNASKTVSLDLDAPPEGLQAVLERLGVMLSPLGL